MLPSTPSSLISPLPEGADALWLAGLARQKAPNIILQVCRNDARMHALKELLCYVAPEISVLLFPAWDCLPYDRVSPNPEITAERLATLSAILNRTISKPCIILSTANALLQKLPPPSFLQRQGVELKVGSTLATSTIRQTLTANGYQAAATVREAGEFAVRGDIIDLFAPSLPNPVRIDRFGDSIESLKFFDPLSQRTTCDAPSFRLDPAREVLLTDAAIQQFRLGYRTLAQKAGLENDPLFAAISAGQVYAGMEHWLPLFHETLVPITAYTGDDVTAVFEHEAGRAIESRAAQVQEYYGARQNLRKNDAYYPVPPEQLFLSPKELHGLLPQQLHTSPFVQPETIEPLNIRRAQDFSTIRNDSERSLYAEVSSHLQVLLKEKYQVLLACYSEGSRSRLLSRLQGVEGSSLLFVTEDTWAGAMARKGKVVTAIIAPLEHGFTDETARLAILTEQDILGERLSRPTRRRAKADAFIKEASTLARGDYVVHLEHGVGQYDSLETVQVAGEQHDCVKLLYAGGDRLFVPVENIDILSRYASEDSDNTTLDKLGGVAWQARKAKVKERIRAIAEVLLKTAALRQVQTGEVLAPDAAWYDEFAARFPYPETEDQLAAIADVLQDLTAGRPMDRLICGDVGFGKTEVAMRAAFIAAISGKQVAVVVPTTLLARQHYKGFQARFAGFPLKIAPLSRLVSAKDAAATREALAAGTIDIVIGTHALLSKQTVFKNLGLVIVDEEQHFGVAQKEKLKELQAGVHLLTLSATPIPRTLQMALSGVRDMSLIATPPVDRLAVRTFVLPYDGMVLREALMREHTRGGQTFYVVPRIQDLADVEEKLRTLAPECKVAVAHGQMPASQLEDIMDTFLAGKIDVLLSTQIIESGIDIPTANTMIIHKAHLFGLAQLYQLRGRVGRGKTRGYAYLTTPSDQILAKTSLKRLEVMQTLDHLGAGFTLASHDMDIRGAGNLLGDEQSGHIREVGIELYQQMLDDAVRTAQMAAKGETQSVLEEGWSPLIQLPLAVSIPEKYVPDLDLRMALYRRAAGITEDQERESFAAELIDRFGTLPRETENLLVVLALKQQCRLAHIARLDAGPKGIVIAFHQNRFPATDALVAHIAASKGTVKLRPDEKVVFIRALATPAAMLEAAKKIVEMLVGLTASGFSTLKGM